jgi:hypothetical protein
LVSGRKSSRRAKILNLSSTKWSVSQITSWFLRTFGRRRWTPKKIPAGMEAAMPGPNPALCTFSEDFLQAAWDAVRRRTVAVQTVQRFRLVLLLHEQPGLGNNEAAEKVGLSARQVQRWRSRWSAGDFSIEDHPGRGRKAIFSPAGSSLDSSDGV